MRKQLSEEKLQLAREFEQGKYKVREFCELHSIKEQNLYYWRKRLRDLDKPKQDPLFLPLSVGPSRTESPMEIRMPNGIVIQFSELIPVTYLQQILGQ